MTEKEKIKALLPEGSYKIIADKIGKTYGTVRDYFAPSKDFQVSKITEEKLLKEAKKIIEKNSLNGLEIVHGEQAKNKIKAALAA